MPEPATKETAPSLETNLYPVSPEEIAPADIPTANGLGSAALELSQTNEHGSPQSQPDETVGYMMRDGQAVMAIERNSENFHLFTLDKETGQYKSIGQHSDEIVQLLEIYLTLRKNNPQPSRPEQNGLAFHDVNGTFHNHVHIKELDLVRGRKNDKPGIHKHTAVFESFQDNSRSEFPIAIDDMHRLNKSLHPFVWEGDDS